MNTATARSISLKILALSLYAGCLLVIGCERDPVTPPEGEPSNFYLRNDAQLSSTTGPGGNWLYITNYIYPTGTTSTGWQTFMISDISGSTYEYDLTFWSSSATSVKIEFVLVHAGKETILASKILIIPYFDDFTAVGHDGAVEGDDPLGGNEDILLFRIKYESGSVPIEILYDGAPESIANTLIAVPIL